MPPWQHLPDSFYKTLNETAAEFGVTRREVLTKGLRLFRERAAALQDSEAGPVLPGLGEISADQAREIYSILSTYYSRQNRLTPQQRSKNARKAAQARWRKP